MNTPPEASAELQAFLRDKILSYEQLETLLLLRRRADETFSRGSVAEVLHIPDEAAGEVLDHLLGHDLLVVRVGPEGRLFEYRPQNPMLAAVVDQLAESYDRNRLTVMNLMNANAIQRVRTRALNTFTSAFILGRKKDEDG
ncbi:MAG TPA: hypothetical protein VFU02_09400 [Polyangiaceae bacterium]|nr:hypothetical protein [Polyangiaceae bacterium]